MKKIFKYEIRPQKGGVAEIQLPKDSIVIHTAVDNKTGLPCVWVQFDVDNEKDLETCSFMIVGTGQEFDEERNYYHLFTYQDGPFVWHLYAK